MNTDHAVGFTGTRKGMTAQQLAKLRTFRHAVGVFHHGACDGADTEATAIFYERNWWIHSWPSHHPNLTAMAQSHTVHWRDPTSPGSGYDPLVRNRLIVDACDLLIATPAQRKEVLRSGTWATIRYAKQTRKPIILIWPSGEFTRLP